MPHVHDLKPGSIGLVAHTMKPHELNGWVKRLNVDKMKYYTNDLMFRGNLYFLNLHVPHGTLVLILSEQSLKRTTSSIPGSFYQVLWGETVVFLKRDLLINPYLNSSNS